MIKINQLLSLTKRKIIVEKVCTIPKVSPNVVILRESTSGWAEGLERIIARCGRQSPHFLSATFCKNRYQKY